MADDSTPEAVAAAVAPELDRIRLAVASAMTSRAGPLLAKLGIGPQAGQVLGMLRNLPPDRIVSRLGLETIYIYRPAGTADEALAALDVAGLVALTDDTVGLTSAGRHAIDELRAVSAVVIDTLWGDVTRPFGPLVEIGDRLLTAAAETEGDAFAVLAPLYSPLGTSEAMLFAEQLTPLRYHRFDCHIAAWRAAGLTATQMHALEDGPVRDAIEADTNARAAMPYAALDRAERVAFRDALAALPP